MLGGDFGDRDSASELGTHLDCRLRGHHGRSELEDSEFDNDATMNDAREYDEHW